MPLDLEKTIAGPGWKKIGERHHHGLNIPLFSIHTKNSSGIGEYLDLLPLIDWCEEINFDMIQLLPINDSGKDSSPYNSLTSCALHPIYLSLHALPYLDEDLKQEIASFAPLNETKRVCYHDVLKKKLDFFYRYFERVKDKFKEQKDYQDFLLRYEMWLTPYALFKVLKLQHNRIHWKDWSEGQNLTHGNLKALYQKFSGEMEYFYLLQYLCFQQFKTVKNHAESKGIFLKGDVPFLVCPDSVDVWWSRSFFDFNFVAGSPPNQFNPEGQYWSFPLYNWKAMKENNFEWWKKRLLTAKELYHLYRIDHILGFFRIWAIPIGEHPSKGEYIPRDPAVMEAQGRELLNILTSFTDMLPIGEDLGKVPPFILKYLKEAGIPGTKLFRWQRDWDGTGSFRPYDQYEPISMSSVSTHDLDTVKLWWQKNPKDAEEYAKFKNWTYEKELSRDHYYEILWDNHHSTSLFHINLLQEYLGLFPELTWENPEDERINYPGTMQPFNWTYRYKLPLETLTTHPKLTETMRELVR